MLFNRSVPAHAVLPHVVYPDVAEASAWLSRSFGFSEHYRYDAADGTVQGAQMRLGEAWFMAVRSRPERSSPKEAGTATQSLTVFVEDVDAHFAWAEAAGATIVEAVSETVYGERQYGAEDLAGHHWLFSEHAHDLNPAAWGATIQQPAEMTPQISPMLAVSDGNAAIAFYQAAFDAKVLWHLGGSGAVVAGLSIGGAAFFLAHEAPEFGTCGPAAAGFTTVRIELFVDDPVAVHRRAAAAGAMQRSPVVEHQYPTVGPLAIRRMLQGSVVDPFGHMWLIGKILEVERSSTA